MIVLVLFVCAALFIFSNCWFLLPPPLYQMPNFALFLSFTFCLPFVTTACFSPVGDSSLTGRLMPVFIPHIPVESHLLYSLSSAHSSPAPRQLPYLLQWKFRSVFFCFVLLKPSLCAIVFSGLAALFFLVLMLVVPVHDRDRLSFYSSL